MSGFYLMIVDVWSNVEFVGPFFNEASANEYRATLNPQFDVCLHDEHEMQANIAEFGEVPITMPR